MKDKRLIDSVRKRYGLLLESCKKCKKDTPKKELDDNEKFAAYGRICNACAENIDA